MSEAANWMSGKSLRYMFCMLLLHSPPVDYDLSDDLENQLHTNYGVHNPTHSQINNLFYYSLDAILQAHQQKNWKVLDYKISQFTNNLWS